MKLIFVGLMYNPFDKELIKTKTINGFQESADTFQWSFINGLIKNNYFDDIKIFNVVPTGTYPMNYKEVLTKSKKWSYLNFSCFQIGCINFPIVKQLHRYFVLKGSIKKELKQNIKNDKYHIVFYSLYPIFVSLVKYIKKKYPKISISVIVPDLPSKFGIIPKNPIKRILSNIEGRYVISNIELFDINVLLTKHMLVPLQIRHQSYVIIEGLFDPLITNSELKSDNSEKNAILYSGSLNKEFGLYNLIEAFKLIDKTNIELWICGSGDCAEYIIEASKTDTRIKFFGQINRNDLITMQSNAFMLVNPRSNNNEYVKYSFPSKTMEYIYSGRPSIMHKLSCLPDEYFEHLYFFENDNLESIKEGITKLLQMDSSKLYQQGLRNRYWILENKSSEKQTKKLIDLIEKVKK